MLKKRRKNGKTVHQYYEELLKGKSIFPTEKKREKKKPKRMHCVARIFEEEVRLRVGCGEEGRAEKGKDCLEDRNRTPQASGGQLLDQEERTKPSSMFQKENTGGKERKGFIMLKLKQFRQKKGKEVFQSLEIFVAKVYLLGKKGDQKGGGSLPPLRPGGKKESLGTGRKTLTERKRFFLFDSKKGWGGKEGSGHRQPGGWGGPKEARIKKKFRLRAQPQQRGRVLGGQGDDSRRQTFRGKGGQ